MDHYQQVKAFFDRTAARYREHPRAFRAFYFGKRLEFALEHISAGQLIIDVGCGRGELYDRLAGLPELRTQYIGLDISPVMLELSGIPDSHQHLTTLEEFARKTTAITANRLVALGLTTYYRPKDVPAFYDAIEQTLSEGGKAIISYTHSASHDYRIRYFLHLLLGRLFSNKRSLGRDFSIFATTPSEVVAELPSNLKIELVHWLPAAIPLVPHWFPHFSTRLAKGVLKNWGPAWRGDFVVVIGK